MEPARKKRRVDNNHKFLTIPRDMLYIVSSFLDASGVIKLKSVHMSLLKIHIPINYCGLYEKPCSIESFINHANDVKKIYIFNRELPPGFAEILRMFRNLTQLHIRKCNASVLFKSNNLKFLHDLRSLGIWDSNLNNGDYVKIASLKKLKYLDLTGTSITNQELTYILENLPNLEQLCLIQCRFIEPRAFDIRTSSNIKQLCVPFSMHKSVIKFKSYANKYPMLTEKKCNIDHSRHPFNLKLN